ncbi:MAG: ABC transporter substrate binding protein [Alphaproteobacteria bacterium]
MVPVNWFPVVLTFTLVGSVLAPAAVTEAAEKKCLFVSSYHQGYAWSDGVERGLRAVLDGKCQYRQFNMDSKHRKSVEVKKQIALEAKDIIDSWKPDVVITADDNAAKYLIQPYFRDHAVPFVFSGINWTAEEYGFPYSNMTGMIEVAPIMPMLKSAMDIVPNLRRAFYLGADTLTESKNLERFREAAEQLGFELEFALVDSTEKWLQAYERAQETDLVVLGSNAGINDWDEARAQAGVLKLTGKLSVTNHDWMMPFAIVGVTKVPEEQGEWAAKAALAILGGISPSAIPVVPNSRRDIWVNPKIIDAAKITLPVSMMRKAKKVL